jgi:hypothetical protein
MSEVANLYDNGPISPVVKIKENVSIFTGGKWDHWRVDYIEPLPRSSPSVVDLVTLSGGINIPANGAINKSLIQFLQLNDREFIQLRFEPLDDVEGVLWEQSATGRFVTRSLQARVSMFTSFRDPWLSSTTFYVIGRNRDPNLEARNNNPVALPQARFAFWGFRYILSPLSTAPATSTYLPAEGMSA